MAPFCNFFYRTTVVQTQVFLFMLWFVHCVSTHTMSLDGSWGFQATVNGESCYL